MQHPFGIEPWGNFLFKGGANIRDSGLGSLSVLGDAQLVEVVGLLGARDLGRLALASKALYCFANQEDPWRSMVIEEFGGAFRWCGCWQETYLVTKGWVAQQPLQPPLQPGRGLGGSSNAGGQAPSAEPGGAGGRADEGQEGADPGRQKGRERGGDGDDDDDGGGGAQRQAKRRKGGKGGAKLQGGTAAAEAAGQAGRKGTHKGRKGRPAAARHGSDDAGDAGDGGAGRQAPEAEEGEGSDRAGVSGRGAAAPGARRFALGLGRRYLRVRGLYSDLLYQPWYCATTDILPDWLEVDNVERRSGLSPEQFRQQYELPNRPVLLTDAMAGWPALKKWDRPYLERAFAGGDVIVGNMPMPFSTYLEYCDSNWDEMPLYLFDKAFAQRAPQLAADYVAPPHFGEDLFGLLGGQRPDYRWLIMGPSRSGSSFHIDPNATSAWNALVWGTKKWVMFPPGVVPPGVHPSLDGADVATPLSLMEWFINFYAATQEMKVRPVEFVARPGELVFVPRGWWHCALNLEDCCALTQNYVSEVGLAHVLAFLRPGRAEMVSGCAQEDRGNLHDRFVAALRAQRPEVLARVEARQAEARQRAQQAHALAALFKQHHHAAPGGACGEHAAGGAAAGAGSSSPPAQAAAAQEAAADGAEAAASSGSGGGSGGGGGFSFGFSFGGSGHGGGAQPAAAGAGGGFSFGFRV